MFGIGANCGIDGSSGNGGDACTGGEAPPPLEREC